MFLKEKEEALMALISVCGDFPCSLINELEGGRTWKFKTIRRFITEGVVKRYRRNGVSSLRLTTKGGKLLVKLNEDRYGTYVNEPGRYHQSDKQKRQRIHDIAVAMVLAHRAGIEIFSDKKPALFSHLPQDETFSLQHAYFYTSHEIKNQHDEAIKIKSARAVGLLLTLENGYFVYSVSDRVIKWSSASERKLSNVVEGALLNWKIQPKNWYAIMIGDNYQCAIKQLQSNGGYRKMYFRLDQTYPTFYFVSNNLTGEVQLRLICAPKAQKRLRQYLIHQNCLVEIQNDTIFDCDAKTAGGVFVLLAYGFDMERLKQFKAGLEQFEEKGLVICLEEQQEILQHYFDGLAHITTIPLSLVVRALADG